MDTSVFDYALPPELIAQHAIEPRDHARLLVADGDQVQHRQVFDVTSVLKPGDLLIGNQTRVIPARWHGHKDSGGAVEMLLVHPENGADDAVHWRVMIRGKVRVGSVLSFAGAPPVTVVHTHADGDRSVAFPAGTDVLALAEQIGAIPLPPYIARAAEAADAERYQTVYAQSAGSVAAPTAGLHFTADLLSTLQSQGVELAYVDLNVGPGTFKPVQSDQVEDYDIHAEWAECPAAVCDHMAACRARGGRIIAIGTTVIRTLQSAWNDDAHVSPGLVGPNYFCIRRSAFPVSTA